MFCKNCGAQLKDGALFCASCGTKTAAEEKTVANQPVAEKAKAKIGGKLVDKGSLSMTVLVLGILSVVLAGIPGLILALICMSKVKKYKKAFGALEGKATAGNILSIIGLVLSIIASIIFVIALIILSIPMLLILIGLIVYAIYLVLIVVIIIFYVVFVVIAYVIYSVPFFI